VDLAKFLTRIEKDLICQALMRTKGNQTMAAQDLNLTKPSLRHRIQSLGIDVTSFRGNGRNQ
jgi:DNA-binding NtrC family response regulator